VRLGISGREQDEKKTMKTVLFFLAVIACLLASGCAQQARPPSRGQPAKPLTATTTATAEEWFDRANESYKKGDYDKAIAEYGKVLEAAPQQTDAYFNRGNTWADKGDYDRAIADYGKASEIIPQFADAYFNQTGMWTKKLDYGRAIRTFSLLLQVIKRSLSRRRS
jgi:tetratricopeptide (TPR) repeat protein